MNKTSLVKPAPKDKASLVLPAEMFSVLGTVPLKREKNGLDDDDYGRWEGNARIVYIHPLTLPASEWLTYWHEATHISLFDSGARNGLTHEQEERICDAMGTYLAAMMRAGMLTVR